MIDPLAYTIDQAVEAGVGSRSGIYKAANLGLLTLTKRSRRTIILAHEVKRYLDSLPKAPVKKEPALEVATLKPRGCKALNSAPKIFTPTK